ncbi:hypothetical protein RRG08_024430 [Elysia crispata]|uniref:Uncharacterized protein n=1 Tax=Elysia crispata TaxID=231223 RepID=A0AAE0YPD8_9GAST|nr:hypothetical protein RRG08_024430 [Elysia crispata]
MEATVFSQPVSKHLVQVGYHSSHISLSAATALLALSRGVSDYDSKSYVQPSSGGVSGNRTRTAELSKIHK